MNLEHQKIKIDINSIHAPTTRLIENVNDTGIRFVDMELFSNSIKISIPDTVKATATFVTDGKLISDEILCDISDGSVVIPIDNSKITTRSGLMLVEVTLTDTVDENTNTVLNTPHAFKVRVTPSIKDSAQITESSFGTTAEILKEVSLARGNFNSLDERLESKANLDDVYTVDEADSHFLSADEPKGSVDTQHIINGAVTTEKIENGAVGEDELNSELVEKINSKANADLCIKQSSTQLIKLTDIDTSINGLHIIIKNNHISVKGTAEKGVYSSIAIETGINQFEANTSYTASIQNLVDNTAKTDYIGLYCSGVGVPITEADEHKALNFTTDTQVSLNWNIQAGTYDKEFDFQIEFGLEVTPFEPYYVVGNVANGSVSKEKLSEDVQDSLNVMNVELPKKAESSDLLNKSSFFEFEDITSTVGVETGYYYGAFNHNSVANFECTANPISCKSGDIFKITSATVNMDGHQAIVKCYDKNQVLISSHFEASGTDILTVTDKLFIVPENVEYVAFNCWKHDNNLYNLKVEKAKPYTNNYGLLVNTLVSSLPSNELLGKSIYSDGDSIAQGTGTANRSYAYLLADKYNMTLTSRAVGGTTIAVHPDNGDNKSIYERVVSNVTSDSKYDYIILDGGTNDITKSIELGTITDGVDSEFNTSTVLGALEAICKHLNTVQLTAKKLFVFVTNRVEMLKTTKDTFSKMKQVLNKWGIPYIDLSTINSLGRWNDTVAEDYFADEIHPNLEAHKEFYLPYIEKALLYGSYANDSSDSNVSVSLSSDEKNEIIAQVIATLPDDVIGISDAEINNDGELVITYTDKSSKGLGVVVGQDGKDGVSCTHVWSGDTLTVTSASGTSSRNLKGEKGDKGDTGATGADGSDYVLTDTDKTEIANIVINEYDSSIMAILGGDNDVSE